MASASYINSFHPFLYEEEPLLLQTLNTTTVTNSVKWCEMYYSSGNYASKDCLYLIKKNKTVLKHLNCFFAMKTEGTQLVGLSR